MKKVLLLMVIGIFLLGVAKEEACAAVTGLEQVDCSTSYVSLCWNKTPDEDVYKRYDLQISTNGISWGMPQRVVNTSTTIRNLKAGTSYWVRVSVKDKNEYTEPLEITTSTDRVPLLYQSNATTDSITIEWDYITGATSYRVYGYANGQDYLLGETEDFEYTISASNTEVFPYTLYVRPVRTISSGSIEYTGSCIRLSDIELVPSKSPKPVVSTYYNNTQRAWIDFTKVLYSKGFEYELQNVRGKKLLSNTTSTEYIVASIKSNEFYRVRIRQLNYIGDSPEPIYGEWSDWAYLSNNPKLKLKKISSGIKLSWGKNKRAKQYIVYGSTKENKGYKKLGTTKKNSFTVKKISGKKLQKGKKYYFYVVTVTKVGSKLYKSGGDNCYWIKK